MLLLPAASLAAPATRAVTFQGYRLVVPASWPVYRLATAPTTCVRFDRHAVYLGQPGANQNCPAQSAGRTEAILV
ncbi:MAG: glycoside hydrolase domain-containing protein, partial [Solirubrobacteraceae bacterium]